MQFGQKMGNLPRNQHGKEDYEDWDSEGHGLLTKEQRRVALLGRPGQIDQHLNEPADRFSYVLRYRQVVRRASPLADPDFAFRLRWL